MRNPGIYGPRVIGQEQYELERKIVSTQSNIYGPRVLGDDHPANQKLAAAKAEAEAAEAEVRTADDDKAKDAARKKVLAARKKIAKARQDAAAEAEHATPGTIERTLREPADPTNELVPEYPTDVSEVMRTDEVPDTTANLMWDEMNLDELDRALATYPNASVPALDAELRRESPRKGALKAILAAEYDRAGGPRDEVVKRIEEAL